MRNNKILATAIASALPFSAGVMLLGASGAFAADAELISHGGAGEKPPVFATQLFPGETSIATTVGPSETGYQATSCGDEDAFHIRYKIPLFSGGNGLQVGDKLYVSATLNGSAGWGGNTSTTAPLGGVNPATHTKFCGSVNITVASVALASDCLKVGDIAKSSIVGDKGLSTVEFVVTPTVVVGAASAFFFFCPEIDADFLQGEGQTLSLTMSASLYTTQSGTRQPLGSPSTVTLASSAPGSRVDILASTTPGYAAIDFSSDGQKFLTGGTKGTATAIDRVSLGTIDINDATSGAKKRDGSTDYKFSATGMSGKLTITDGIFAASMATNQVFLDKDDKCQFDATTDIAATKVTETTAEWTVLTTDHLTKISGKMYVCVVADGIKAINEQPRAPLATFSMGSGTQLTPYTPARLRHIKESGTRCTLFNIPDGSEKQSTISTDVVSIRITNNGSTPGKLYATLRNQKGEQLYTPDKRVLLGEIAPYQTIRYYTGQETGPDYSVDRDLAAFGNVRHWVGERATLIIGSDLDDISIFGLVRNRHGGPNMNISTGATGSGCD